VNVVILGRGAWGRALGSLFESNQHDVQYAAHTDSNWPASMELLVLAVPVQHVRETLERFPVPICPVLNTAKGLEIGSGLRVSQILHKLWPEARSAILSGPTLAEEVAKGLPAAAVVASAYESDAAFFQQALHQSRFRLYRSTDLAGVELGGALKNVYALAGGVCEGLNLGENARAALLTRSLAELTRLGVRRGGRAETFFGLSGAGDLMLTASSPRSRNFRVGLSLARGGTLDSAMQEAGGVVEGVMTAKALVEDEVYSDESKPVADAVHAMLYRGNSPREVVQALLSREVRTEH
jgi:glycerol-3-phosphate dehydrogenase (NAD(P)+)